EQIDPVRVLADQHPVLVAENTANDYARRFLGRYAQHLRGPGQCLGPVLGAGGGPGTRIFRNARGYPRWMHASYLDRGASQLLAQTLAQAADRIFAGAIGGLAWRSKESKHAGDIHQVGVGLALQHRKKELAAMDHSPEVN